MSVFRIVCTALVSYAAAACATNKPAVQPAKAAHSHETMTAAGHATMHGGDDSSFSRMQVRGQMAMGVDQYMSAHKFDITPDGGRIELQTSTGDSLDIAQIRAHMKLIQHAFVAGDFSTPAFVHNKDMPGTAIMAKKKALISYEYGDLPHGAEVRISTSDPEAREAIAAFLQAQRMEHRAGGADQH